MTWCLNRGRISLCLMYLFVVVKHHRGCHQFQRGRFLAKERPGFCSTCWDPCVGNMMLNVVLDVNPLDEDDGNLLLKMFLMFDEFINDVNMMFYK